MSKQYVGNYEFSEEVFFFFQYTDSSTYAYNAGLISINSMFKDCRMGMYVPRPDPSFKLVVPAFFLKGDLK